MRHADLLQLRQVSRRQAGQMVGAKHLPPLDALTAERQIAADIAEVGGALKKGRHGMGCFLS